jgi:hypothetical protein
MQVEVEAKAGNYRLHCNDQWKTKSKGFGHAYMTQDMGKEPILQMESDKMISRYVYDKPFMIRFPDGSEWYTDAPRQIKALELGCVAMGYKAKT